MTDPQENKLSMYISVQTVVNKNDTVWSGLPAFVTAFGEYEGMIQDIQNTRLVQEGDITGVPKDKAQAKEAAIQKALEVSTAVYAYAAKNNNNTLKEKVNYSPSDLRRSRDTVLIDRLQVIHNEANNIVGDLGDYGIDANDLTDLQGLIDAYENLVEEPRAAITNKSEATAALVSLFKQGDALLNEQLDKLMEQFKEDNGKFYTQYFNARIIIDLGVRHEAEEPQEPEIPSE
ncbi:hypothetical protein LCGC14_1037880 [marine sediment metagenome]|uniref:Uncharacterized protein n=1 Tax=marine sediment metagenome TaxID=412755 RepID=A0A0F9MSP9_9ZZZZ